LPHTKEGVTKLPVPSSLPPEAAPKGLENLAQGLPRVYPGLGKKDVSP
jgi:hypothetical protein